MSRPEPDEVAAAARQYADRHDGATVSQVLGYYLLDPEEHAATVARALDKPDPTQPRETQATLEGSADD
jgi:hypothetical protein